jgi:hypothetical protein
MEQIYASNCFDKKEMVDWENKPVNIKDDYNQAKMYFEGLVRDFETYTQNSGDHGKKGYESANQMADVGDEIRKYIHEIASASAASNKKAAEFAANVSDEAKAKDAQFQAMTAQIQALTHTVATLSTAIAAAAKENGGGGGGGGGEHGRTFKFTRNMGAYCYSCGHHPIGANHTSVTCTRKRDGHNDQRRRDRRPPVRWEQLLARTQQSQVLPARSSKVQRQICQQLTGTGAGSNRRKRNKQSLIIKLLLYFI